MSSIIVGIEFDQSVFPSEIKCEQWMRSKPDFQFLILSKMWRLKTVARSIWMSSEGRKVFAWYGPLYQCKDLQLERPDPYVLVIKRSSSSFFADLELPALSARGQKRLRDAQDKQETRDRERSERKEKARDKKRQRNLLTKKSIFTTPVKKEEEEKKKPIRRRKKVKVDPNPITIAPLASVVDISSTDEAPLNPLDDIFTTSTFESRVDSVK